jgi:AcrR family transcriptional regulator
VLISATIVLVATRGEPTTKGEQTRRSILRAAVARFGREGYRATSVADVARDAGVGGTVAYAYFPNKEALFFAAVDEDAAGLVNGALAVVFADPDDPDWRRTLFFTMIGAVDHHPLARRLLAGLEPEFTARVLDIPALAEMRKASAALLQSEQLAGRVRADIDPVRVANGLVALQLSLLMSIVQVGIDVANTYADDVSAVFKAAIDAIPPVRRRPPPREA